MGPELRDFGHRSGGNVGPELRDWVTGRKGMWDLSYGTGSQVGRKWDLSYGTGSQVGRKWDLSYGTGSQVGRECGT